MPVRAPNVPHVAKNPQFEAKHHRGGHGRFGAGMSKPKLLVRDRKAIAAIGQAFSSHPIPHQAAAHAFTGAHGRRIRPETVGAFHDLAKALRSGKTDDERIAKLDAAMQPTEHDLVLTRHVGPEAFGLKPTDLAGLRELLADRKIVDKAYTPAALHQEPGPDGITLRIAVPKGTRALVAGDNEMWLDRELELAVGGVHPNGRGGYDMDVTVLPKGGPAPAKVAKKAAPAKKVTAPAVPVAAKKATPAKKSTPAAKKAAPAKKAASPRRARMTDSPTEAVQRLRRIGSAEEAKQYLADATKPQLAAIAEAAKIGYGRSWNRQQIRDAIVFHVVQRRLNSDAITAPTRYRPEAPPASKVAAPAAKKAAKTAAKKAAPEAEPALPSRSAPKLGDLMKSMSEDVGHEQRMETIGRTRGELKKAIDGTYGGLKATVNEAYEPTDEYLTVAGTISHPRTGYVGSFRRSFQRDKSGTLYAVHDYLQIDRSAQGSGFAREFNANLFDWYRRSGFDRVEVHADIDVGGYTWATQGFDFQNDAALSDWLKVARFRMGRWNGTQVGGRAEITQAFPHLTDVQIEQELKTLDGLLSEAENGRPVSAYEISQLGRKPGMGRKDMWIGKLIMLNSDWMGALRL